jgi:hypothetical protein
MTTFDWRIPQLERLSEDGFVTTVYYTVEATDGEYKTSIYSSVDYTEKAKMVTAFDDLTEQEVLGWVQETVNKESVENDLIAKIEAQKTPVKLLGLPWNK